MKIKKIILEKWIDPALITHHLTKKFGDKGLAWLDSDGKENGEWSIIGIKPKQTSQQERKIQIIWWKLLFKSLIILQAS